MTIIIGITGKAGAGKDTAAAALVRELGYARIGLADGVKEAVTRLNPEVQERSQRDTITSLLYEMGWYPELGYSDPSFLEGWDRLKARPDCRYLLQRMGTEVGREMFGEDVWVDRLLRKASGLERVVVPDVRFDNEAQAVRDAGGCVIEVRRAYLSTLPGAHASEAGVDRHLIDLTLINDHTIETLQDLVVDAVSRFQRPRDAHIFVSMHTDKPTKENQVGPSVPVKVSFKPPSGPVTVDEVVVFDTSGKFHPGPVPSTVTVFVECPECKAGKHSNCDGRSWSRLLDAYTKCPCKDFSHTP